MQAVHRSIQVSSNNVLGFKYFDGQGSCQHDTQLAHEYEKMIKC